VISILDETLKRRFSELEGRFNSGQISRRDFLRSATLLGLAFGAAEFVAACGLQPTSTKPFDPLETLYGVKYVTVTPDGSAKAVATPAAREGQGVTTAGEFVWFCSFCNRRFRTLEDLKKHAAAEHAWRLPEVRNVEQPTYSQFLTDEVERFDERNTVFSRTIWDEDYKVEVQKARERAPQDDVKLLEGRALVAGAIYVDATAGTLHPNYYGYMGHVNDAGGLYGWEDPVNEKQYPVDDPAWMSERIKEVAKFYGANLVGITKIDPRWVYSHYFERASGDYGVLEIPYKYAIVMGIEMDWQGIKESPLPEASAATALAYSQMAELSASLAKYIRSLGYPALPCGNDTAQSIPLAIDAGLGELGRNGLMLSPEYGARQRLCKVITDLPLVPDEPIDFGLQIFCETCHACASACPVDAIRWEDRTTERTSISNRKGILRWPVNVSRCYLFWQENGVDCSNCIAACPWALRSQRDWLEV